MRIGEVIGKLTLSKCDPQFIGGTYLIVQPHDPGSLRRSTAFQAVMHGRDARPGNHGQDAHATDHGQDARATMGNGEVEVVYDGVGANPGDCVGFTDGGESAQPLHPRRVAIDAYLACILDRVTYDT